MGSARQYGRLSKKREGKRQLNAKLKFVIKLGIKYSKALNRSVL